MKKLKILVLGLMLFFLGSVVTAQVSVNLNFGEPPMWGPVGYSSVQYYYLPDVEAYYNVETEMFIYISNGTWITSYYLPYRYRNYDLYNGYKVTLDYRGGRPYDNYIYDRRTYHKGYHQDGQRTIGNRPHQGYQSHQYQKARFEQRNHQEMNHRPQPIRQQNRQMNHQKQQPNHQQMNHQQNQKNNVRGDNRNVKQQRNVNNNYKQNQRNKGQVNDKGNKGNDRNK